MQTLPGQAAGLGMTLRWDLPVPYSAENPVAHETILDQVASGAARPGCTSNRMGMSAGPGEADKILGNFLRDP